MPPEMLSAAEPPVKVSAPVPPVMVDATAPALVPMIKAAVIAEALIDVTTVLDIDAKDSARAPVAVTDVAAPFVKAATKFVPEVPPNELMVMDSSLAKEIAKVLPPAAAVPVAVAVVPTVAVDVPKLTVIASAVVFTARDAVTVTSKSSAAVTSALA